MDLSAKHDYWMRKALNAAYDAERNNEVPVGAVVVCDDELIAVASNAPISLHDPTAHAEVVALRQAAEKVKNYRLVNTTLYVTLEPCMMCAGAMLHARVSRLVYGASDPKTGVAGGKFNWLQPDYHTHKMEVIGGVLEDECSDLLKNFFKRRR